MLKFNEAGFELDEDGHVVGVQFGGRERRIQEWREKKEEEEFRKLCERLAKRNYQRKKATHDEGRMQLKAAQERYRKLNHAKILVSERRRKHKRYKANPVVNVCKECGASWCPLPQVKVKRSKFCSRRCRNRNYKREVLGKNKRFKAERLIFKFVEANPDKTSQEIGVGCELDLGVVRTLLCKYVKRGQLVKIGVRGCRYRVKKNEES